jgi:hypothetical protein
MKVWFNRMNNEEKDWLEFFLLEKIEACKKHYISILENETYFDLPVYEIENYKLFCENEIKICESLIDKYNADFNEFLQKRVPPPF